MQQIPEGGKESLEIKGQKEVDIHIEAIQHEIDILFSKHEEIRANISLNSQMHTLWTGFIALLYSLDNEEHAAYSLGWMYFPFLASILLHWPVWKIRKFLYLYRHHKEVSRKGIQDPRDEK